MTAEEKTALFVEAVQARRAAMYHVALSYLRRSADAEDAVADAISATWAHLDRIREPDAMPAYLMQAAIHACHHTLRKRRFEADSEDGAAFEQPVFDETPLWEYINHLPETLRVPLMMRYGDNIPEQEIAAALHLRRGTVSSRLARGLQKLREQLREEEEYE